jgi:excisionase family DNA binding protein
MDSQLLYSPEEAARLLSIGRTQLYELMARGELASVKVGRNRKIKAAELRRFVDELLEAG